jgi:hypothetical protein
MSDSYWAKFLMSSRWIVLKLYLSPDINTYDLSSIIWSIYVSWSSVNFLYFKSVGDDDYWTISTSTIVCWGIVNGLWDILYITSFDISDFSFCKFILNWFASDLTSGIIILFDYNVRRDYGGGTCKEDCLGELIYDY